jgi:gamma-glutamylcyclotransferase
MSLSQTLLTQPTIYFGYGSNLWLHQMSIRCPTAQYLGVARLPNYTWLINNRGYANIVELSKVASPTSTATNYSDVVYGLVYSLLPEDEKRLDRNEHVPIAYTKELIPCDFWPSTSNERTDTSLPPFETKDMLVYIDRNRTTPDEPRDEYVYRMNQGIKDALEMGVPEEYVNDVMRKYIPEGDDEKEHSIRDFARTQAAQFKDESGLIEQA